MSIIFRFSILVLAYNLSLVGLVDAAENRIVPSYTMEALYERATTLKRLLSQDNLPNEHLALLDLAAKAAEFRGYVAGTLDQQDLTETDLVECSRRNTLSVITARAANVITSVPLDRDGTAGLTVLLAIHYACDESNWKKK